MQKFVAIADIAKASGKSRFTITRRAKNEGWKTFITKAKGGKHGAKTMFSVDLLPYDIQKALLAEAHELVQATGAGDLIPVESKELLPAQSKKAYAKADLARLYSRHLNSAPWGRKSQARTDFIHLYAGLKTWPTLYKVLGPRSWQSIERWANKLKSGADPSSLADTRGYGKKGFTTLSREQTGIILTCTLQPNAPKISYSIKMAKKIMAMRGIANGHSEAAYRRFLQHWKERNLDTWTFLRYGEAALEDNVGYDIVRDFDKIAVGDVIVADGHTLNFETINPFTGKPKRMTLILWFDMKSSMPLGWVIMPSENTQAISAALMYAIITLGKYPKVAYMDNGRAFRAKFFNKSLDECGLQGLYARLGIETTFAWAYHGKSKTIERFFGTMHELESMMPTYVGNCIDHKPPRMQRGEKLHVQLWDKAMQGRSMTMEETYQVVANFFDEYAKEPRRGHLNGKSPLEVFEAGKGPGVDRRELRFLMMEQEIKQIRQHGITLFGNDYYHPALYGRAHSVNIKYDLQDPSAILVYDGDGSFICEAAQKNKVHPMARILGDDADRAMLKSEIELKQSLKKQTVGPARRLLQDDIMPDYIKQLADIGLPDNPETTNKKGGKIMRLPAPNKRRTAPQQGMTKDEAAAAMAEAEERIAKRGDYEAAELKQRLAMMTEPERYEELIEMQVRGDAIPAELAGFMDYFQSTAYYRQYRAHYEDIRARAAIMYQMSGA